MPIPASSLQYTVGPVIAVVAVVVIILFMRWAFSHKDPRDLKDPRGRHDPFAPDADSTGLLEPVATLPRREQALALRAVLSDAGIRSTIRLPRQGGAQVLVFPDDVSTARALAGPFGS